MLQFCATIYQSTLIGHNANFDIGFLNQDLQEAKQKKLKNQCSDMMKMCAELLKTLGGCRKLSDIMNELNICRHACHRAKIDCYAVQAVYEELKKRLTQ